MSTAHKSSLSALGPRAYLLLSGGQDSLVCLLWAKRTFDNVHAISFDYGQRHLKELTKAKYFAQHYNVSHQIYSIKEAFTATSAPSALLNASMSLGEGHPLHQNLPSSFVPARNGLFLTFLAMHALRDAEVNAILHLVIGACEVDYAGYPDCRYHYLKAKEIELSYGFDRQVIIHAPLMWYAKADILHMAWEYGALDMCLYETVSCYEAGSKRHVWGYGCGTCSACSLRAKGYAAFKDRPLLKR